MHERSPWWLVAGVFLVLAVSSGFGFYNLSVYMNALAAERGFAVADLSAAVALLFLASGICGVAVGRAIESWDVRWVMLGGAALGGLALGLIGEATAIWQVWLLFALFGAGNSGVSLVPGTTVVTRWFPGANRSIALSVASTGLSMGGLLLTPLCANVLHVWQVEASMPWFGVVYFLTIAPIAALLVRSWPPGTEPEATPMPAAGVGRSLRSRFFVGTVVAYIGIMASQVGGIAHMFNHVERFAGHVVASTAVMALTLASIAGRLGGGFVLAAGVPIRAFTAFNVAGQSIGLAVLAWAAQPAVAVAGAVLFGVTIGNLLMLQPLLLVQAFGPARYPRIFAIAHAASTAGVAGGPLALGIAHDLANYGWAFGAAALASVCALFAFLAAGALPTGYTDASEPALAGTRGSGGAQPSPRESTTLPKV